MFANRHHQNTRVAQTRSIAVAARTASRARTGVKSWFTPLFELSDDPEYNWYQVHTHFWGARAMRRSMTRGRKNVPQGVSGRRKWNARAAVKRTLNAPVDAFTRSRELARDVNAADATLRLHGWRLNKFSVVSWAASGPDGAYIATQRLADTVRLVLDALAGKEARERKEDTYLRGWQ